MERAFKIGCRVIFFDSLRQPHEALVTNWFHGGPDGETVAEKRRQYEEAVAKGANPSPTGTFWMPCCNVVWTSSDSNKTDPYGRQLERQTSCSYGRQQGTPFLGNCWCWPDEFEEAMKLATESYDKAVAK